MQSPKTLRARIDAAFEYLFPLFEIARTRFSVVEGPRNPRPGIANRLLHARVLADHSKRAVTTPNNDTLYSSSWLDLSDKPVVLEVPRIENRYWSVALMDVFTNNFAVIGSRLDGAGPVRVVIAAPSWPDGAMDGVRVIRAPSNDVWLLCRWLVDGLEDVPAVHAIQDALLLEPLSAAQAPKREGTPPARPAPAARQKIAPRESNDPAHFLAVVNEMLGRNPVPASEAAMVAGWADIGVSPGDVEAWSMLAEPVREAWLDRIGPAHEALHGGIVHGGARHGGWAYPSEVIGNFGANYEVRAAVALGGLAALESVEALYLALSADEAGAVLDGSRSYRLTMPAGGLEADAFWSLSIYEVMPDGRLFFVDNPLGRFAVGDRSRGLARNPDGSIDLWIGHDPPSPAEGILTNWLPAPAGAFRLVLRAYQPRRALLEGRAPLPRIELLARR